MVVDGGLINQMEFKRKNHRELRGESLILVLKCSCLQKYPPGFVSELELRLGMHIFLTQQPENDS